MAKVYAVIGYDSYYPLPDNIERCFYKLEQAEEFLKVALNDKECYYKQYYEIIPIKVEGDDD